MMDRRRFIQGFLGAAALAALPMSAERPFPHGWVISEEIVEPGLFGVDVVQSMARALARSMIQTKEVMMSEVFEGGPNDVIYGTKMYLDG